MTWFGLLPPPATRSYTKAAIAGTTSAPPSAWSPGAASGKPATPSRRQRSLLLLGMPGTEADRRFGRYVVWHCGSCDRSITDHGMCNGPADNERSHAGNCPRLAKAVAAWDAE